MRLFIETLTLAVCVTYILYCLGVVLNMIDGKVDSLLLVLSVFLIIFIEAMNE